jgi:hypothetical protein
MHTEFWLESLKERDHIEDISVGERVILKWILGLQCVDWIYMAKYMDLWGAVMNVVMNMQFP